MIKTPQTIKSNDRLGKKQLQHFIVLRSQQDKQPSRKNGQRAWKGNLVNTDGQLSETV